MRVAILRYPAGNVRSVEIALQRVAVDPVITADPEILRSADKVIFPGVGEAASAMAHLRATGLDRVLLGLQQPVLGICLGMQLLCAHSEEGDTPGLGVFPTRVRRFPATVGKVPQIGWNTISQLRGPLFEDIAEDAYVYYVHGYRADVCAEASAITDHGGPYAAALSSGNFHGVQFHPERSADVGARILDNFLAL